MCFPDVDGIVISASHLSNIYMYILIILDELRHVYLLSCSP
jgi:hypothetical protein